MELCQATQSSDQALREKIWLCEELDMGSRAFQEDRAREIAKKLNTYEEFAVQKLTGLDLKLDERESFYSESAYGSDSGLAKQGEFLE